MHTRRGLLLLAVTLAAAPVALSQSTATPATLAARPVTKPITFEVVSLRQNVSQRISGLRFTPDGFSTQGSSVRRLLLILGNPNIAELPDWCNTQRYDVAAKVSDSDLAAWRDVGINEKHAAIRAMLEDRFKMKSHVESRMAPGFELVIAKNGPKLKESKTGDTYPNLQKRNDGTPIFGVDLAGQAGGIYRLTGHAATMDQLTHYLSQLTFASVVDRTGLTGTYDFQFTAAPQLPLTAGNSDPPVVDGPSIFSVVQEQLGLKLSPVKVPVETLVIDHIEHPSEN